MDANSHPIKPLSAGVGLRTVALLFAACVTFSVMPAGAARVPATGVISSGPVGRPVVALTFDDGPSPYTPGVLKVLRAFHVPATFFIVGFHVPVFPNYLKAEVRAGEEIGNHTYSHLDLKSLSTPAVVAQLQRDQATIHGVAGVRPHWFRPPYGDVDDRIIGIAASLGLRTVTWSVDPSDWTLPGKSLIVSRVVDNVQPGSIVILHDGGGDRSETVGALPTIIRDLRSRGYRFGTLDQLFGFRPLPLCIPHASRLFSRAGVRAHPHDAIYGYWLNLLCRGLHIGPATGRERVAGPNVLSQNFARTGHRILWTPRTGKLRLKIIWSWVISAFSRRGVSPRFGDPITRAWFHDFLGGQDWGAALAKERKHHHHLIQRFRWGVGRTVGHGRVKWLRIK